jgi:glucosamine--fructose-6-phosphate aminotransferase (isomerizing)
MANGQFTRAEIASQSATWTSVLARFEREYLHLVQNSGRESNYQFVVTGCGSTYYLSMSTAALLNLHGIRAYAYPASELLYFTEIMPREEVWLMAISRSGATTETLWATNRFRQHAAGGKVLAITCDPDSDLAQSADIAVIASDAQESSVVQTRSFTSMFLLSQALAAVLAGKSNRLARLKTLPDKLPGLLERTMTLARSIGEDLSIQRFFFLGGGPLYGLASEAMLKTKEMALTWSEAYHPLELRHGPKSVVDKETLIVALMSDSGLGAEVRVLREMKELGARTLALVEEVDNLDEDSVDYVVELQSGLTEWERGVLYMPFIHWMVYHRAVRKALDPDKPTNLSAVVELE